MDKIVALVWDESKAYFFKGDEYTRYDIGGDQADEGYPQTISSGWAGVFESDFDAAVVWPNGKAYFFKGDEYIRYDVAADRADEGYPQAISSGWAGVFQSDLDAAVVWPNGKAYFFKRDEYIRYDISADRADDGYPQAIRSGWAGVFESDLDAAVVWPNGKAYFFKGDEYIRYDIGADRADDGYPQPISAWALPFDGGKPAQHIEEAGGSVAIAELNSKRQSMLDLIDKWMPTSLNNPRIPDGETQDLMARAGWTKATGQDNKKKKDAGERFATSCGDVLHAMLVLWKSNFLGFFNIRDVAVGGPGAKARGFYVERAQLVIEGDVVKSPKPGDIIVLRNGIGRGATGVGHVGILVEARKDKWKTADGGGGSLPDQTAAVTERDVRWVDGVPIMKSVTDIKEKELDGWVDLDKLEQTG